MSWMQCRCGATISDVVCPSPTEGEVLRQQDKESFHEAIGREVAAFVTAMQEGRRDAWIAERFGPQYPTDIRDAEVILDLLTANDRWSLSVAECASCGRLWVQVAPCVNRYRSYSPDEPGYAAVLRATEPS